MLFASGAAADGPPDSVTAAARQIPPGFARIAARPTRGYGMLSLYASTAMMQALDIHSTLTAVGRGGVEANPLISGLASRQLAFIAVKSGIAASSILAARQMAKHNKLAAVVTLIAINSAYALVISHNYKLAHDLR
jgi:hypothetical protein